MRWRPYQSRRPTDTQIGRVFTGRPGVGGLAVVLGRISGGDGGCLAVRDFDDQAGYDQWAARRPDLAPTLPTVRTHRGYHVYCRLRGRSGSTGWPTETYRADARHYVALPPSWHPSGRRYEWVRWPLGPSAFPVLAVEGSGFLEYVRTPLAAPQFPRSPSPATPTRHNTNQGSKPDKTPNALCPIRTPIGLSSLPLPVREAILRTLPRGAGQRNDRAMRLARSLYDISPGVPFDQWFDAVRVSWLEAGPAIRTQEFSETWKDFVSAWGRVETPASASMPLAAFRTAADACETASPRERLVAGCRAMAAVTGGTFQMAAVTGGTFHLAVRTVADVLGLAKSTAGRLLRAATSAGELEVVEPGIPDPRRRIASTYRLGPTAADFRSAAGQERQEG